MAQSIDREFGEWDSLLFLSLFWGGKPVCSLVDVIWLCDWVNRDIPSAKQLDGSLNRLMAAGLVIKRRGGFGVPLKIVRKFDAYRKRRRRNRFVMADEFVQSAGPLKTVPRRVTIRRSDHKRAYAEYLRLFDAAAELAGL
jgi:hypothetical protein